MSHPSSHLQTIRATLLDLWMGGHCRSDAAEKQMQRIDRELDQLEQLCIMETVPVENHGPIIISGKQPLM